MPRGGKRPCRYCRRWFEPAPQQRGRQYACSRPECQAERKRSNQGDWVSKHPEYFRGRGEVHRAWREAHPEKTNTHTITDERRAAESRSRAARRELARLRLSVEQDALAIQLVGKSTDSGGIAPSAEQVACLAQCFVIVGLAVEIALSGEQDSCGSRLSVWHDRGKQVLRGLLRHGGSREAG